MQAYKISDIPLSAVSAADNEYRITGAGDDSSALAASMAASGLLIPILVTRKVSAEAYTVVSGFKRLEVARTLGWETIPCRVADENCPESDLAKMAVAENAFQRQLTPGELVRGAGLLSKFMDANELADISRAVFNTGLNSRYIKSLLSIFGLPTPAVQLLDSGQLSIKAAKLMTSFDGEAAGALLNVFSVLNLSASKQTEIITWTREIAAIEGTTVSDLLQTEDIRELLPTEDNQKDRAAAGNNLRALLFNKRYPHLDAARKAAADSLRSLKLPKGIRMTLPENFESTVYSATFSFSSVREFAEKTETLQQLSAQDGLKHLLNR
ncbi:MAG: ParB/RepB/Spo0J family partition protein [Desulfobacterales bacterium]|nr:ParB/RepB/Spo0J family partition protein [Desulfobacterales bacterium]